jgi:outer membrane lipoprotein SlyB
MKATSCLSIDVITTIVALAALVVGLTAAPGAHAQSGNVYGSNQVQTLSSAEEGIVLQVAIKKSEASWQARTGGAAAGGVVGALLGNAVGGDSQTKTLLNTLGVIGGGFAGERAANAVAASEAQEIVIGLRDPKTKSINRVVTVVQPAPFDAVATNDKVLVINTNGAIRVLKQTFDTASVQR